MKRIRIQYLLLILTLVSLITIITVWGADQEQQKAGGSRPANDQLVQLTVYNQDLALVKDRRVLVLNNGISNYRFTDVASKIDPTSVKFYTPNVTGIRVLEQNYEYDVVNDSKLLQKFLGEKITVVDTKGEVIEGYLLGAGENLVLSSNESGGEVQIIKNSQVKSIRFPELPGGLVVKPTLVWLLQNANKTGEQLVEVSYLTGGLSWSVDYVATINQKDDRVDLTGWVTLNNQSGASYENASLKLIAGKINQVKEDPNLLRGLMLEKAKAAGTNSFSEESFFEYHMYTLNRPTSLKNNQIKQVELLSANTVVAKKLFIYQGARDPKRVKTMLEFSNSSANNMGIPLPNGRIRVQKADQSGSLQFIGEDRIDHTPKDETVRIYLGDAFDIVGERIQTEVKEISKNSRELSYRIVLRNHKKEAVTVTAVEEMPYRGDWKITNSSHNYTKKDAAKVEFIVNIPANGEQVITYTVRYK
ncbi:MAG TPA: DUF4139 domain-containing protein [Bacillota bacterium]|nr:DUF4139 domain-containing protein [Bacillota bacterium]HOL08829.1 DUF4139 domain-containing protein [Bacillota bacterium]HPO98465.1 DUF4139 domain-containing protein [Bacillota bacterium]